VNVVVAAGQRFHNHIVNARPHEVHVDAYLLKVITEGRQAPLKADIVLLGILILHKLFILFIDGVVGQMHVAIILIELS